MSNIIDFLERLGQDAQLSRASDDQLERELINAQIDPEVREAILLRDQRRLESLLGTNPNVCCMIIAPAREQEDDEDCEDEKRKDDDSDDEERAVRLAAG